MATVVKGFKEISEYSFIPIDSGVIMQMSRQEQTRINKDKQMQARLEPFKALLDARYAPVLLLAVAQSYTIGQWLFHDSDHSNLALIFAVFCSFSFDFANVAAIAWTETDDSMTKEQVRAKKAAMWFVSGTALIFSTAVSLSYYGLVMGFMLWPLHAGFPILTFGYMLLTHTAIGKEFMKNVLPVREPETTTTVTESVKVERSRKTGNEQWEEVLRQVMSKQLTPGQAAVMLNMPVKTVYSRLNRAGVKSVV